MLMAEKTYTFSIMYWYFGRSWMRSLCFIYILNGDVWNTHISFFCFNRMLGGVYWNTHMGLMVLLPHECCWLGNLKPRIVPQAFWIVVVEKLAASWCVIDMLDVDGWNIAFFFFYLLLKCWMSMAENMHVSMCYYKFECR